MVVSQAIDLSETALLDSREPEVKSGAPPGVIKFGTFEVDTSLLHNTHSWIVICMNSR
jgi:hypothetical protein